ncbi:AAA family ATPase [Microbacterium paraoxydans]|uniref:AAA family ATPase n=1 Tax=Microbacterium paraoxydans TaxID=199592 RepID=UPI002286AAFE|nr:AAA family ATPase [Microbacterium paraoxydans]MCZ0708989.1 AAA family ATPase [Microbacterium paraoxydans]
MALRFQVVPVGQWPGSRPNQFTLVRDGWDDFTFKTSFRLYYRDTDATTEIGTLKIAHYGMGEGKATTQLDGTFPALSPEYFSLGQDREYYLNLAKLPGTLGEDVLHAMNDIALDLERFDQAIREPVVSTSLLREIDQTVVRSQFHWLARGFPARTDYRFDYTPPRWNGHQPQTLVFDVRVDSTPPTNVHVLIGSNGVGKSTLMRNFAASLRSDSVPDQVGSFTSRRDDEGMVRRVPFDNVVTIAFSAFDTFPGHLSDPDGQTGDIPHHVIGLRGSTSSDERDASLTEQFAESLSACQREPRRGRWLSALSILVEADPVLRSERLETLVQKAGTGLVASEARARFAALSSGHKIAVLTLTAVVRYVEERTLLLIDEPETHLHPPLLSALVRAVTALSVERNGVAILATHSPVVLQDVPRSCVFVLSRNGGRVETRPPNIETFGESVSVLTSAVFGLRIDETGYHDVIERSVASGDWTEMPSQLGAEGRSILRALQDIDTEDRYLE